MPMDAAKVARLRAVVKRLNDHAFTYNEAKMRGQPSVTRAIQLNTLLRPKLTAVQREELTELWKDIPGPTARDTAFLGRRKYRTAYLSLTRSTVLCIQFAILLGRRE